MARVFDDAYRGMLRLETASGGGSTLAATAKIRRELPSLLARLHIRSILDAPCGDFHWMKELAYKFDAYYGCDIVPDLVRHNAERYGAENRQFMLADLTRDPLPRADLVLCRDCLVHLSFKHALSVLRNFRNSGAQYLLTTDFPDHRSNVDIVSGDWRPLNLRSAPFELGTPLASLNEGYDSDRGLHRDKSLGLWLLQELRV